jgi:hypothetical protein
VREETIVKIVAIVSLVAINITALIHGIDTVVTSTICAIIGGIAGYSVGVKKPRKQ